MSRLLIQKLAAVQQEFETARAAISYLEKHWSQLTDDAGLKGTSRSQGVTALRTLEQTYLTRLFSEFDTILIAYLEDRAEVVPSKAFDLVDKVASRRRAKVPNEERDAVHQLREYRAALSHAQGISVSAVTFRQALSILSQFLDFVPEP
ncbi:MAG: hypothetical protein ACRYFS_12730 [Janthinobacterium lividum]